MAFEKEHGDKLTTRIKDKTREISNKVGEKIEEKYQRIKEKREWKKADKRLLKGQEDKAYWEESQRQAKQAGTRKARERYNPKPPKRIPIRYRESNQMQQDTPSMIFGSQGSQPKRKSKDIFDSDIGFKGFQPLNMDMSMDFGFGPYKKKSKRRRK